ncbi:MAG: T9SS type A sorting domain-containing protein [Ignavibacteria bacterium]|nr:T9SS type A sorting domain-containing protein [Ignavibacteria bacterium]MBI3766263.1 T9SS type A sorting domain-containing protein [Ignavibacteriales bacterium]
MNGGVYDPSTFSGSRGVFFRTTDGGTAWQLFDIPIGSFSFVDTVNGFSWSGYDDNGLYLIRTRDGGVHWDTTYLPFGVVHNDQFFPDAISYIDTLNGWMFCETYYNGGSSGMIIRTSDGGNSWIKESIGISYYFGDAMMLDQYHGWAVTLLGEVVGYELITSVVEHLPELPTGFILRQNYPNPFNSSTVIEYEIPEASNVRIAVYDETGKLISTLVDERQLPGVYRIQFDARSLSSGIYYYTMQAGLYRATKQLIFLK